MKKIILTALIAAMAMTAIADVTKTAKAKPTPVPGAVKVVDKKEFVVKLMKREKICSMAYSFVGVVSYWPGGDDPQGGMDCSGFTQYIYKNAAGINIPKLTREQYSKSRRVAWNMLQKGDLVFFTTVRPGPSHVGIYAGGGKFIHSPNLGKDVEVASFSTPYWAQRFLGGGNLID